MKKYNHAFTIAFIVDSDNDDNEITADELIQGVLNRLSSIMKTGKEEMLEACGAAFDTYEN